MAALGKLHVIGNRLIQTNLVHDVRVQKYPSVINVEPENKQENEISKEFNSFTIIGNALLERTIINLYNLIEVHKELLPHLTANDPKNLKLLIIK